MPQFTIPYLHPKVDISDLQSNGKLFSDGEIAAIHEQLAALRLPPVEYGRRFRKRDLKTKYPLIEVQGHLFALYKGRGQDKDELGKALGAGSFGTVKLIQDLKTGEWFVLKVIKKQAPTEPNKEVSIKAKAEADLLSKVYKGSIHVYGREDKTGKWQAEIVMPLEKGLEAFDIAFMKDLEWPMHNWIRMGSAIVRSIKKLHEIEGLYHRDIKLENVIYNPITGEAKIIDFGLSVKAGGDFEDSGRLGTPVFMAPELDSNPQGRYIYNQATEMYAMGVALADLFGLNIDRLFDKKLGRLKDFSNIQETVLFRMRLPDPRVRRIVLKLLKQMGAPNPEERPTLDKVLEVFRRLDRAIGNDVSRASSEVTQLAYINAHEIVALIKGGNESEIDVIAQSLRDKAHVVQLEADDPEIAAEARQVLQKKGLLVYDKALQYANPQDKGDEIRENTLALQNETDLNFEAIHISTSVPKRKQCLMEIKVLKREIDSQFQTAQNTQAISTEAKDQLNVWVENINKYIASELKKDYPAQPSLDTLEKLRDKLQQISREIGPKIQQLVNPPLAKEAESQPAPARQPQRQRSKKPPLTKTARSMDLSFVKFDVAEAVLKRVYGIGSEDSLKHLKRMTALLKNDLTRDLLLAEARRHHTDEGIEFLIQYQDYMKSPSEEKYQNIVKKFIEVGAPLQVNIDDHHRKRCLQNMDGALTQAAQAVALLIMNDSPQDRLLFPSQKVEYPNLEKKLKELRMKQAQSKTSDASKVTSTKIESESVKPSQDSSARSEPPKKKGSWFRFFDFKSPFSKQPKVEKDEFQKPKKEKGMHS